MLSPINFADDVAATTPVLKRFAMALCKNPDRASDLVQDTIVAALVHENKFERGTNLLAWLTVVMRNKFRTGFRRTRREVEDPDDAMAKAMPFDDSPLRKIEAREILELVDLMPPSFAEPLRLLADGATYDEIAAELHEHEGTIKSRINRARNMLRAGQ